MLELRNQKSLANTKITGLGRYFSEHSMLTQGALKYIKLGGETNYANQQTYTGSIHTQLAKVFISPAATPAHLPSALQLCYFCSFSLVLPFINYVEQAFLLSTTAPFSLASASYTM